KQRPFGDDGVGGRDTRPAGHRVAQRRQVAAVGDDRRRVLLEAQHEGAPLEETDIGGPSVHQVLLDVGTHGTGEEQRHRGARGPPFRARSTRTVARVTMIRPSSLSMEFTARTSPSTTTSPCCSRSSRLKYGTTEAAAGKRGAAISRTAATTTSERDAITPSL